MAHLVMALLYVDADTPDDATAAVSEALRPVKAESTRGTAVSFAESALGDPTFWPTIGRFNITRDDLEARP